MSEITVLPFKTQIKASLNENLLDALNRGGFRVQSLCGGRGVCGKCKVIIKKGKRILSALSDSEKKLLTTEELNKGYRLACHGVIRKNEAAVIEIPLESREEYQKLSIVGLEPQVLPHPAVRKIFIKLSKTTLKNINSDLDRIIEALSSQGFPNLQISYKTLKEISSLLRRCDWEVTAALWMDKEISCIESGDTSDRNFGIAFDIGTTKIAGYFMNLKDSSLLGFTSRINSQRRFGEDIISRITHVIDNEETLTELNRLVRSNMNDIIDEFCNKFKVKSNEIYDLTFVGNTAMHHILMNLNPTYLTLSPYPPVVRNSFDIKAHEFGVNINPNCYIHALPVIAGFVGSDVIADIISTGIHKSDELSMLIDIGTNAEIILGNKERIVACSCASGPAFEGGHIKHGIRAQKGAIEKIWIEPKTLNVFFKVIGDVKPTGICGSGVVDAISEMFKANIIDERGYIIANNNSSRIINGKGLKEFLIAQKDENAIGGDITITQSDIREIQLAKAAIYTGCLILMKELKVSPKEIERLYLAGSFGTYINPDSAKTIGIFPNISTNRMKFVGNTAGSGARMALKSKKIRGLADKIANRVRYIELGAKKEFQEEFLNATFIPHKNAK
ncbi:MAG: DUF4445 domain-containing protein [Thermoplasmata archaeon]|nr:MAG: DUF4445 domain-containing protein [Thermoplasmata archaeon]